MHFSFPRAFPSRCTSRPCRIGLGAGNRLQRSHFFYAACCCWRHLCRSLAGSLPFSRSGSELAEWFFSVPLIFPSSNSCTMRRCCFLVEFPTVCTWFTGQSCWALCIHFMARSAHRCFWLVERFSYLPAPPC